MRVVIGGGDSDIMVVVVVVTVLAVITLVELLYLSDGCPGLVCYCGGLGCGLEMGERRKIQPI